jgi:hypothetical protein
LSTSSHLHVQSIVFPKCGISYSTPLWSLDVANAPREQLIRDLNKHNINIYSNYARFYPQCTNISRPWIEIAALFPLLARLPPPPPHYTPLQSRTLFLNTAKLIKATRFWKKVITSLSHFGVVILDLDPNQFPMNYIDTKQQLKESAEDLYYRNNTLFQHAKTLAADHLSALGHTGAGGLVLPSFRSDEYVWLDNDGLRTSISARHLRNAHDKLMSWCINGLNSARKKSRYNRLPILTSYTNPLLTCFGCNKNPKQIARYGAHVDSSANDSQSQLTISALFYLTSSGKDDGNLRLGLLNLDRKKVMQSIDVRPQQNRLVLFLSKHIPHSVQQTFTPRFTVTSFLRTV